MEVSDPFSVPSDPCIDKSAFTSPGKGNDLGKLWLDFFFALFIVGFEDCMYQPFNIRKFFFQGRL